MADSYVFYRSQYEAGEDLYKTEGAESYYKMRHAIDCYALDGKLPEDLTGGGKLIFCLSKPNIDANTKRRENGAKGGRPPKTSGSAEKNQRLLVEKPDINQQFFDPEPYEDVDADVDADSYEEGEGDEKEGSGERETNTPGSAPDIADVIDFFVESGVGETVGEAFFDHFAGVGWMVHGKPIDWRYQAKLWIIQPYGGESNEED